MLTLLAEPMRAQDARPSAATVAVWDSTFDAAFRAYDRHAWLELARMADRKSVIEFQQVELRVQRSLAEDPTDYGPGRPTRAERRREFASWERLSADSVLVRTLRARMEAYRRPELEATVTRSIVGHAPEGDSLVHIVFRYHATWKAVLGRKAMEEEKVSLLTLRRSEDQWHPMLSSALTMHVEPSWAVFTAWQ
jgi:hypothetical protein